MSGEMIKEMCFFVCVFCLFVCFKTTPPVHACFQSGAQKADKVFDTPHVWTEKCNAFRGERERETGSRLRTSWNLSVLVNSRML